jgi:uncharacterized protein (TIGR00369 family)
LEVQRRGFGPADAQELLRTKVAPWAQELNLVVEQCSTVGARLRMPYSTRLLRAGNTICGQALMAAADTALAIAICGSLGGFRDITTVGQNISFMRPIADADVLIHANVRKLGRNIIFGEATLSGAGAQSMAAHATAIWALVQSRSDGFPSARRT